MPDTDQGSPSPAALQEILQEARRAGFLGPGPIAPQLAHAEGFAQLAQRRFNVPRVVVRVADPARAAWYAEQGLHTVSPTALAFTLEAFRRGANLTLKDALNAEFLLTRTTMAYPDFAEGVRAMVVDKDRQPRWQPARIEEVDPAAIAALFGQANPA